MKKQIAIILFLTSTILIDQSYPFTKWFEQLFRGDEKKARLYYGEGNFDEGLKIYSKLTSKNEETPLLLNNVAIGQSMLGEKNAEENFRKAIELLQSEQGFSQTKKKQLADIYFNLGQHYFSRSLYKKAIDAYVENLKLSPDDITARHNLELSILRQNEKTNSPQKDNEVSPQPQSSKDEETNDTPDQKPQSPSQLDKQSATSLKLEKDEQRQQQEESSKITPKRAKEILESLEQTWNDRDHVKTYQEIFSYEESGKKW